MLGSALQRAFEHLQAFRHLHHCSLGRIIALRRIVALEQRANAAGKETDVMFRFIVWNQQRRTDTANAGLVFDYRLLFFCLLVLGGFAPFVLRPLRPGQIEFMFRPRKDHI